MTTIVLVAAWGVGACAVRGPSPVADPSPVVEAWQVLFDGSRTIGLRAYGGAGFPVDRWAIRDGRLWTVPGPGTDLISEAVFDDFEVEFRWAVSPGGNGGVIYRADETEMPAWTTGPEYQLLDDGRHPDGGDPTTSAASVYDLLSPDPAKVLADVGDDNDGRIVVQDDRVEHWLNGRLVVAYDWRGAEIRERVDASKFRDLHAFMSGDAGHIVLQHHGEEVSFSLVRIRPL